MSNLNEEQQEALDTVAKALRHHYIQGNSQIHNVNQWLYKQVTETMQTIRTIPNHDNLRMISDNCKTYRDELTDAGHVPARIKPINIYDQNKLRPSTGAPTNSSWLQSAWLNHAAWMCIEILRKIDEEPEAGLKINRWYGCLQGYLMMGGICTLDECREHNRTGSTT